MKADHCLVSIIMNCLNSAAHLPEALASVHAQTFDDYEIIFWDNGSTDQSAAIARGFGPKLRYFLAEQTTPLGTARNLAIAQARGKFIAFLDCDDLWRPTKLQKQVDAFMASARVGLVCTDTEIFNGRRTLYRLFSQSRPERGQVYASLLARQWISMSSAMIRRTALDELADLKGKCPEHWFDESLNVCEEADVFYRIAHDWDLDFIDEPLTVWRVHGANTTFRKFGQFAAETRLILAKHKKLYPDLYSQKPELAEMLEQRAAFQEAVACWQQGDGGHAREIIKPYLAKSTKNRLFWGASFLPGAFFNLLARLYFALPRGVRRQA